MRAYDNKFINKFMKVEVMQIKKLMTNVMEKS